MTFEFPLHLLFGAAGSGKSTHAARLALQHLQAGHPVHVLHEEPTMSDSQKALESIHQLGRCSNGRMQRLPAALNLNLQGSTVIFDLKAEVKWQKTAAAPLPRQQG